MRYWVYHSNTLVAIYVCLLFLIAFASDYFFVRCSFCLIYINCNDFIFNCFKLLPNLPSPGLHHTKSTFAKATADKEKPRTLRGLHIRFGLLTSL